MTVISTLLRRLQKARSFRPGCPLPARTRLHVTLLEDRTVPTTLTWIGGAMGNDNWSTSGNWADGGMNTTVPSLNVDVLVFDGSASTFTSNNDISSLTVSDIQLSFSGYTITGSQPVTVNTAVTDTTTVGSNGISLNIDGTAVLTKSGGSSLFLSGTNTFTGATTVSGGVLELGGGAAVADTSAVTVAAGATLNLDANETIGSLAGAGNVTLTTFTLTAGGDNTSTTFSGVAGGTGGITKAGTGTLTLSGTNTYTGATTASAGSLTLNGGTALADASALTVDAAAVLFLGASETIGSLAGAGSLSIGAFTLTTGDDNTSTTFSGGIGGSGGVTKTGTGTLTFSGTTNNFTGATTVSAGTLALSGGAALDDATAVTVSAGAVLLLNASETIGSLAGAGTVDLSSFILTAGDSSSTTFSGIISGASGTGGITKAGTGTLTLSGTNAFTGVTTVSAGTLTLSGGTALADTSAVTVSAGATLALSTNETIGSLAGAGNVTLTTFTLTTGGDSTSTTFSGAISGTGGLTMIGAGTFTLSGANTYTGATTVSNGTLAVSGNSALADTSAVTVSAGATLALNNDEVIGSLAGAGSVTLGANFLTAGADNSNTTFSGVIGGTGTLTKQGTGTFILSGINTYTGATTVSAGTLSVAADNNLGTGAVTLAGTTILDVTGTGVTIDNLVTLSGNATVNNANAVTLSGIISGANNLTKTGAGVLTLSGVNTYTGITTVSAGTLSVAADNNLGTGAVTLAGTTILDVTGTGVTIDNLVTLSGSATVNNANAVTLSGIISETGGARNLAKTGAGVLTLSGVNTYTGTTTASAGTLSVTGSITGLGVQVANGGTLGGTGTVPAVTAANGGTVAPGTSPGILSTGNLALAAGSTFSAEVNGATVGTGYDQAAVTGTVDVTGATLTVTLGFTPVAGTSFTLISNDLVDAVTGTFNGLAEGATFTVGGVTFSISYVGGTGNDVVITTAPPTVSINNVTAAEGNTGGTSFTFTVTLSVPSSQTVTVNYATAAGTATAGTDFTSASGTVTFAPGETSKTVTVTVTGDTAVESDETFTVVLSSPTNTTIATGTGTGTITNDDTASATVISIGGGGGAPGTVVPVDPATGQKGTPILAFAGFGGEIRVASGDINGDGQADTITGAGAGAPGGHVKVFAADGTLLRSFLAFDGFSGGVFVTSGDVNGDGFDDIIVSADAGATPHVKVFSGADGSLLQSFFAYDIGFRGGVRVSVGDVNGDGFDDIVTGTGPGSTAHVKAFSGKDGALIRSFFAYDAGFSGGVYVAAGDVNGDGLDDIVTGSGPGTTAHVKVFSGADGSLIQSFLAYDAGFRGGVRVGVGSVNGSAAVLTGAGPGAGPHVKAFVNGVQVASLLAGDPAFSGGVYVG